MIKSKTKYRLNTRKLYEGHYKLCILKGYEVHHNLPIRLGGTDDVSNLSILSLDEHKKAHLDLYEKFGDHHDLTAYHMIGSNFTEAHKLNCSLGGKACYKKLITEGYSSPIMKCDPEVRSKVASIAGKKGGIMQRDNKIGIHAQTPEERRVVASKGGKNSVKTNGWLDSKVQSENGKRGGVKNKGFRWYNDGESSYKYTLRMQECVPFEKFIEFNEKFKIGRVK